MTDSRKYCTRFASITASRLTIQQAAFNRIQNIPLWQFSDASVKQRSEVPSDADRREPGELPMSPNNVPEKPDAPAGATESTAEEQKHTGLSFPVVGLGASAGGLEAIIELLENLPSNPGLALLLVLHLEPRHKSQLPEILSRV